MTLHPDGKKGVNISKSKYDQVKEFIISTIQNEISFKDLTQKANHQLNQDFDGNVT